MSARRRHNKAPKGPGAEYWGKRPLGGTCISHRAGTNKRTKQITHKIERQRNFFGQWLICGPCQEKAMKPLLPKDSE